jgi:hypothetical protein
MPGKKLSAQMSLLTRTSAVADSNVQRSFAWLLACLCLCISQSVFADEGSGSNAASNRVLRGGANDTEMMHRSVKVLIPPVAHPKPAPSLPSFVPSVPQRSSAADVRPSLHPGIQMNGPGAPGHIPMPAWWPPHDPSVSRPVQVQPVHHEFRPPPPKPVGPAWRSEIDVTVTPVPFRPAQLSLLDVNASRTSNPNSPSELQAVEKTLPNSAPQAVATWEEWYKRVAQAIYDRWAQNTAGPGDAIISINVSNSHYVDCRVVQFTPALGAVRSVDAESQFKTTALKSISTLSGDSLWAFPSCASRNLKQIIFDMELKHAVGETAGCNIVHMHDLEKQE